MNREKKERERKKETEREGWTKEARRGDRKLQTNVLYYRINIFKQYISKFNLKHQKIIIPHDQEHARLIQYSKISHHNPP